MSAKLSTHLLDTASGCPAAGVRIEVYRDGEQIADVITNADRRCDGPLLAGDEMFDGPCEIHFHLGAYFTARGIESPFLNVVPVHFQLCADRSFHVPLVASPWSYSTYRGS